MTERDDRVTVVETGGGGGTIDGLLIAGLILIGLFFLFGDQLSGGPRNIDGGPRNIDVDLSLPKVEAPAKQ